MWHLAFLIAVMGAAACGSSRPSAAEPTTKVIAGDPSAPRPFTAEQIRGAMPVGTEIKLRLEAPDKPPVVQHWVVVAANAEGCTIASRLLDEQGNVVEDEGVHTSKWAELVEHAAFPAAQTTITDSTTTVPAGTFATRLYVVKVGDSVRRFHFAPQLPGPPVDMTVEAGGRPLMRMTLLERR